MEANEMTMEVEAMNETTESMVQEAAKGIPSDVLKIAAGVGVGVIAGVILYKYVAVPLVAKFKARKKTGKAADENEAVVIVGTDEDVNDETD